MLLLWLYLASNQALLAPVFPYFPPVSCVDSYGSPIYSTYILPNNIIFEQKPMLFYIV